MVDNGLLDGGLIGVNPIWFCDREEKKYLWTGTIYHDRGELISTLAKLVDYTGPDSLKGLSLGGVMGFSYFGLDFDQKQFSLSILEYKGWICFTEQVLAGRRQGS